MNRHGFVRRALAWTVALGIWGWAAPAMADPSPVPDWWKASEIPEFSIRESAAAGDFNGDQISDVAFATVGANIAGDTRWALAFVYHGAAAGPSASYDWAAEHARVATNYFAQVANAGDVNGDGCDDAVVGIIAYSPHHLDADEAMVYYGAPAGLSTTACLTEPEDSPVHGLQYGAAVAGAGDVNGDGFADVLVGAPGDEFTPGQVFVYSGAAGGVTYPATWGFFAVDEGTGLGSALASAGDVNGDGFADVILGERYYDHGETNEGRAVAFYGSSAGLSPTPNWAYESDEEQAYFGTSVAAAGDVNGDGFADVIVGADHQYDETNPRGRVHVFYGSASGLSPQPDWAAKTDQDGAMFGASVASAGDVNGDGFDDVLVGAWAYGNDQTREGRAHLYLGSASGLSTAPAWTAESNQDEGFLGSAVAPAGDVNDDGTDDILIVATGVVPAKGYGVALVYYGSAPADDDDDAADDDDDEVDDDSDDDSTDDDNDDDDDSADDDDDDSADDDDDDSTDDDDDCGACGG